MEQYIEQWCMEMITPVIVCSILQLMIFRE